MMIRAATFRRALWTWTIGGLLACSGKEDDSTGKDPNAERDQKSKECISDAECSDGLFCNGAELCLPEDEDADDFGCIKARKRPSCDDGVECTQDSCSDSLGRCLYEAPDEDGDGHGSSDCEDEDGAPLGDDCDDEDAKRFPGNFEVCDAKGHDEDCDLSTFGERDRDGDGEWDAECCNGSSKQKTCGTDCNDLNISQRSKQPEFCDDLDNDCDGEVDNDAEPVAWYPDDDLDLFGRDVDKPKMSCTPIVGSSVLATDCIDGDPSRHPAAAEVCDDVDNDCDGLIDEPAFCMTGGGIEVDPDAPNGVGGSGSSAGGSGGQSSSDGGSEGAGGSGGAVSTGGSADTGGGSGTGGEGQAGDCIDQLMGRYLLRSDDGVALYYDNTDQKAVREATTNDPIEDFVEVSDGEGFGCGLLESGEVLCWSTLSTGNRYGELGWGDELTGSAVATPPLGAKPVVFEDGTPLTNFKHVARYGDWRYATSACAISADDELYCWGDIPTFNDVAQPMGYAIPVLEEDGSAFDAIEQVAVGDDWACAVRGENSVGDPENQVWCVGHHASSGRLGNGSPSVHSPFPTPVAGSQGATQVALVDSTACALIDGNVKCWGSDVHGLLGNGPDSTGAAYGAEVSVRVDGSDEVFEQVIAIQGGDTAFCAVTQANEVGCWGYHTAAQQVTGEAAVHRTPQDFLALGALFQVNAYLNIYYLSTDGQFHGESGTVIDPWCSALD